MPSAAQRCCRRSCAACTAGTPSIGGGASGPWAQLRPRHAGAADVRHGQGGDRWLSKKRTELELRLVVGVLCPEVVGRDTELAALVGHLDAVSVGQGGLVCLVGEAGIGESRVVRELTAHARERSMIVLSGRAVPGATPLPFRPLTEALLVAGRRGGPPRAPELAGFGGQLARLVPDWGMAVSGGADESPVLIGEAVVRLLGVLGRTAPHTGCLLVLEDLHWADPETLAVVD